MNKRVEPSLNAPISGSSKTDEAVIIDESKAQFERLKRSVRVTGALLHAIKDARKLLNKFSAPFLEHVKENDSQNKISARKKRQRNAVFAAAQDVLDPEHPIKKSVEASIANSEGLDPSIGLNAHDVQSKVLAQLDKTINKAISDANEQKSAEFIAHFTETVQALTNEMDLCAQATGVLHKKYKDELLDARVTRLLSTTNIVIMMLVVAAITIGSVVYLKSKQRHDKEKEAAAHGKIKSGKVEKAGMPTAIPEKAAVPAKTIAPALVPAQPDASAVAKAASAPVVAAPAPQTVSDAKPDSKASQKTSPAVKMDDGVSLTSGQNPEARKKGLKAMSDAIREWNEENAAEAARTKGQKK